MNTNYPISFCPPLQSMLKKGEFQLSAGEKISIRGASTINNLLVLRDVMLTHKPTKTMEIGLAFGASAMVFVQSLLDIHGRGEWTHIAIDPYQSEVWKNGGRDNVRILLDEQDPRFEVHENFSMFILPGFLSKKKKFGLIYVDGSHIFENVFVDFYYSVQLLEKDGIILFDDCTDPHVNKVIKFIRKNYKDILEPFGIPFLSSKPFYKRIINRLGYAQLKGFRKIAEPPRDWRSHFEKF